MAVSKSELLPVKAHWNLEITITLAGLVFTCIATAFLAQDLGSLLEEKIGAGHLAQIAEQAVFIAIVFSLIYGNVVYQLSRLGFLIRNKRHRREELHETLHLFQGEAPAVAILVPSYKEETRIIYQTLMSAALQH